MTPSKKHHFDGIGICLKCDYCNDPDCCDQTMDDECYGTNWDFMNRMPEIAQELMEHSKGNCVTKTIVSFVASCITILAMRMAGKNDQRFNYLGLVNVVIWTWFTIITAAWPLMFLNVNLAWTYTQNIRRWKNGATV